MALNKFMHPRNIYCTPPDFKQLSLEYPEFGQYVSEYSSGKAHIDFSDPNAVLCLTQTLLKRDFNLNVTIPSGHLIPTIPQRLNYILWIEDLLSLLKTGDDNKGIMGIDIGTGPSCIYPLLGRKKNDWKFLATEVDQEMLEWAKRNVCNNKFDNEIEVVKVTENSVLDHLQTREESFDFCLCNPPFFCDHNEADSDQSRTNRRPPPKGKNSASKGEKTVRGGEVEFVKKMIQDSLILKEKVRLYTTMLGKKKSLAIVKKELKKLEAAQFVTTEFCQGKTMRWGVAWTFLKNVDLTQAPVIKSQKPKPPLLFIIPKHISGKKKKIESVLDNIKEILEEVKIEYGVTHLNKNGSCMWIQAETNTWSHQRRKRREVLRKQKETMAIENTGQINVEDSQSSNISMSSTNSSTVICLNDKNTTHKNNSPEYERIHGAPFEVSKENSNSNRKNAVSPANDGFQNEMDTLKSTSEENNVKKRKNNGTQICCKQQKLDRNSPKYPEQKEKSDSGHICSPPVSKDYLLFCDMILKKTGNSIILKMQCKEGSSGREPMHQVLQLFRNRLK